MLRTARRNRTTRRRRRLYPDAACAIPIEICFASVTAVLPRHAARSSGVRNRGRARGVGVRRRAFPHRSIERHAQRIWPGASCARARKAVVRAVGAFRRARRALRRFARSRAGHWREGITICGRRLRSPRTTRAREMRSTLRTRIIPERADQSVTRARASCGRRGRRTCRCARVAPRAAVLSGMTPAAACCARNRRQEKHHTKHNAARFRNRSGHKASLPRIGRGVAKAPRPAVPSSSASRKAPFVNCVN